jgi:quercetin dioxygenase-like cupin family protein
MQLRHASERAADIGSGAWFTGSVWLDELAVAPRPSGLRLHRVTFQPGARTAWHSHPLGQVLHGIAGVGIVASQGSAPRRLLPGDTIWIAPEELHWHGAAPGNLFVHLAVQEADADGQEATWFEHVAEVEYLRAAGEAV